MMDFINSLTLHQYFLIGGLIATIPGTYAIVEAVKARHFKKTAEDLASRFVVLNVLFWGNLLVWVDAITNNLGQITHIGTLIPAISPFVATWAPIVTAVLLVLHIVAVTASGAFKDMQARKPITNVNMPDLASVAAREASPTVSGNPSSSFGTASAGVDVVPVVAPPADIFTAQ